MLFWQERMVPLTTLLVLDMECEKAKANKTLCILFSRFGNKIRCSVEFHYTRSNVSKLNGAFYLGPGSRSRLPIINSEAENIII